MEIKTAAIFVPRANLLCPISAPAEVVSPVTICDSITMDRSTSCSGVKVGVRIKIMAEYHSFHRSTA